VSGRDFEELLVSVHIALSPTHGYVIFVIYGFALSWSVTSVMPHVHQSHLMVGISNSKGACFLPFVTMADSALLGSVSHLITHWTWFFGCSLCVALCGLLLWCFRSVWKYAPRKEEEDSCREGTLYVCVQFVLKLFPWFIWIAGQGRVVKRFQRQISKSVKSFLY
jgi:hypothetical protein